MSSERDFLEGRLNTARDSLLISRSLLQDAYTFRRQVVVREQIVQRPATGNTNNDVTAQFGNLLLEGTPGDQAGPAAPESDAAGPPRGHHVQLEAQPALVEAPALPQPTPGPGAADESQAETPTESEEVRRVEVVRVYAEVERVVAQAEGEAQRAAMNFHSALADLETYYDRRPRLSNRAALSPQPNEERVA
ncbi:MAG TPA: hypothetical protein V6D08_03685 [Candidatus Obscuribacterales bacterium]